MNPVIIEVERAAAGHWRAPDEERLGGWLLRAAQGFTGRANSALPLGDPGLPASDAVAAVVNWYGARELTPMIVIPAPLAGDSGPLDQYLAGCGWTVRSGAALVMTAAVADVPDGPAGADGPAGPDGKVRVDAEPDDAWRALYHYRGAATLPPIADTLLNSAPWQAFGSIRTDDATAIAVGRVSVADGWGAITAVEVDPAWRRRGLGGAITSALCTAAAHRGATRVLLQVEEGNTPALRLYAQYGFRPVHRYHYRVAPTYP